MTEDAGSDGPSVVTHEWIEGKRHVLFRKSGRKWAYAHSHGDGKRWDVVDAGYRKLAEIPASNKEEAINRVMQMAADGSLQDMITDYHTSVMERRCYSQRFLK